MKVEIGKAWCIRMAELEADAEIGAGRLAVDPVFDGEAVPVEVSDEDGPNVRVWALCSSDAQATWGSLLRSLLSPPMSIRQLWSRSRTIRITSRNCARPISLPTISGCRDPVSCRWQG